MSNKNSSIAIITALITCLTSIAVALLNPALVKVVIDAALGTATPTQVALHVGPEIVTAVPTPAPQEPATLPPTAPETPLPDDCLASAEWQFSPNASVNQEPCLNLLPYFIAYDDGRFDFSALEFDEVNLYGVSRPVPLESVIEATFTVDELEGGGRLWLGLSAGPDPRQESLMFVILPNRYIAVRTLSNGNEHDLVNRMSVPYFFDQAKKTYVLRLESSHNRVDLYVNGGRITSTAVGFTERRLFLGYQAVREVNLSVRASLHDLSIR